MCDYSGLIHAILSMACRDYDMALRYMMRPPEKQTEYKLAEQQIRLKECEHFFRSEWFQWLSDMDGEALMRLIRENGYYVNNWAWNHADTREEPADYHAKYKKHKQKLSTVRRDQRAKEVEEWKRRTGQTGQER